MKVFISWSGELSRQLGEAIRNWLPSALQQVKPYFTPDDIDKGSKWASEIFKELSSSSVCVIILTRDNLTSNWIMFEAGAISSTLDKARVCPIVFDLEPTDVQGPLAQFQATRFAKSDIHKLFNTINSLAGDLKLPEPTADIVFEKWWPDLENSLNKILEGHTANAGVQNIRSDRDLIEEILLLLRASEKEKTPSRPSVPYEGTVTAHLMNMLKRVVDEQGWITFDYLHAKLREAEDAARRLPSSQTRTIVLTELAEMIEKTVPQQPPKTKSVAKKRAEMDDDIPF